MKILSCAVSAILVCLSLSARCESYALLRKNVAPASGGGLAGAQGMVEWTDAAAKQVMGWAHCG